VFGWKTLGPNRISNRCAFNRNPRVSLLGHFPINGISLFSCRVKKSFSVSSLSGGTHFKVVPAPCTEDDVLSYLQGCALLLRLSRPSALGLGL